MRRKLEEKVRKLKKSVSPEVGEVYEWYNGRVLEDTKEIGMIVARHDMIITPQKGLVLHANDK